MTVSIQIFEDLLPNGTDHANSAGAQVGAGSSPREAFARFIDERSGSPGIEALRRIVDEVLVQDTNVRTNEEGSVRSKVSVVVTRGNDDRVIEAFL